MNVTQTEETVGTTLRVPLSLWKRLANTATDRRATQNSIWLDALTAYLDAAQSQTESL